MSTRGLRLSCLLTLAAALACERAPAVATQDHSQNVQTSRIEGDAVVRGTRRGNLIIFLFDATRPPPPTGTGRPVSFTLITKEQLFGNASPSSSGPFTAPYSFSLVPEGRYLLRGFLDVEGVFCQPGGCRGSDFNPWYGVTSDVNRDDVGGAAVEGTPPVLRVVEIAKGADEKLVAAKGISFTVDATQASTVVPVDRPAFQVTSSSPQFNLTTASPCSASPGAPKCKFVDVAPQSILSGPADQRAPAFLVRFIDNNNDCVADDISGDGQPDLWPRVFVRKQAEQNNPALLIDENDWDRNGVVDTTPPSPDITLPDYEHADSTLDGDPDAVILAAGVFPDSAWLGQISTCQVVNGTAQWATVNPPPATLRLVVQGVALDVANPTAPVPLKSVPAGKYSLTLMQFTGQTWRLPNELQAGVAATAGFTEVTSQGWFLDVVQQ